MVIARDWAIAKGKPMKDAVEMNLRTIKPMFDMLREVLLDACRGYGLAIGNSHIIYRGAGLSESKANDAKDRGSAWLFMAWELEERQKEAAK
jgi:hypothetical protein